jgi:CheY-like chemotaxis protein
METNSYAQKNGNDAHVVSDYLQKVTQNLKERLKKNPLILSGKGEEARKDKIFTILLIENNITDMEYIRQALRQSNINFELITVRTGEEAMTYLNRKPPYEKHPVPDIVILDLILPDINGKEIVSYIRENRHLSWIPLIVISEEKNTLEENFVSEKKINSCLKKPFGIGDFYNAFVLANKFWFMNETIEMVK